MLGLGITILFPVCGALRLARFNVENGIKLYFVGLPIPTAGGLLALLSFFKDDIPVIVLLAASLLLSLLMVSSIRYPGFRNFNPSRRTIWVVLLVMLILAGGGFLFEKQLYELQKAAPSWQRLLKFCAFQLVQFLPKCTRNHMSQLAVSPGTGVLQQTAERRPHRWAS